MLIKDHATYTDFFRLMATHHKQIRHCSSNTAFVRMNLSSHPILAREDIKEFIKSLKNKLNFPALLLNTFQAKGDDSSSADAKRKIIQGEFFILDRMKREDWDQQDSIFQDTEQIGTDIIAFMSEYYEENPNHGVFDWNDTMTEKVSNLEVDSLAGTKFYFTINIPHEVSFQLNADAFEDALFDS